MAITLQSHQVDIHAYARDLAAEVNASDCPFDWVESQLELKTWTAKDGSWKAELLITYGGPTVTIEFDSRYTFGTLNHSWGASGKINVADILPLASIEFDHTVLKDVIREIRGLK
tara:strand:- start:170 stop:514 length:345 start_codon:yes stop_codon:yes gene_type:complete